MTARRGSWRSLAIGAADGAHLPSQEEQKQHQQLLVDGFLPLPKSLVKFCCTRAPSITNAGWPRRPRRLGQAAGYDQSRVQRLQTLEPMSIPMVFSSYPFLFGFLPVVLALCWG
ncbi:hypothetical protein, partial [Geminicoccus harenae]|uniref:hypothetical protein n=1 Tax=Geminicoccus harenae TaxID=2498453 RepID=UPI001C977416